ncbi:MAG: hypothetical protein GX595_19060 [Lentisphaerae bacterium]|nr:hypothetical protein [Lentisphaerota bacterium]
MVLMLASLVVLTAGAAVSLLLGGRSVRAAHRAGPVVTLAGGLPALAAAAWVLVTGETLHLRLAWDLPLGSFSLCLDPLAAFFALAIAAVAMLAAVYGHGYLLAYLDRKPLGVSWCLYNLLAASMLMVTLASNGMLFLIAWELMSLTSFLLVLFEHERPEVRRAGWTYLVAMHLGTAALLLLFVLLGRDAASLDFASFAAPAGAMAGWAFVLALIGFGTKAGLMPLHVWLPEAHPAAPSHVSAVMSGVMIKTGLYGLLRLLSLLGPPPVWWGWTLLLVGAASGVLGVLMALTQRDLKRLLAYSSVENIGIIGMGFGLGLIGQSTGHAALAVMGFAGGLLHIWNHAVFKSLLFLAAGSVVHATGSRDLEALGGLLRRLPATGLAFAVAAAAICGLPPFNGFVSEFLLYLGALAGLASADGPTTPAVAGLVAILALALIGGLAVACFTRALGIAFLGEPRSPAAAAAHEAGAAMRLPMAILAAACLALGLAGPLSLRVAGTVLHGILPGEAATASLVWTASAAAVLTNVSRLGLGLVLLTAALAWLRRRLLAGRPIGSSVTWDCGYAAPSARMQYTASSFAWPIVDLCRWVLRTALRRQTPSGTFPATASLESQARDVVLQALYRPIFLAADWCAERLRWVQQGQNQLYVLYIALTLLALLIWKLGAGL